MTSNTAPRAALQQAIDRDERLVACDLLRGLCHLLRDVLDNLLLGDQRLDIFELQDSVEQLAHASRASASALNNARITRRGTIRHDTEQTEVPEPARPFLRLGHYLGTFDSLRTLALHLTVPPGLPTTPQKHHDLTGLGIDLHLQGVVWTIDLDHQLHAFRPHQDPANDLDPT